MTENEGKPPDKRKRRPGQEAASHVKAKVNSGDNATSSTEPPPNLIRGAAVFDAIRFEMDPSGLRMMRPILYNGFPDFAEARRLKYEAMFQRFVRNISKIYIALFPDGVVIDDGTKLRLGNIEVDLKGGNPGHWIDSATGERGENLFGLTKAAGLDWLNLPELPIELTAEIVTGGRVVKPDQKTIGRLRFRWERWLEHYEQQLRDARAAATPVEQALRPKSFSDLRAAGVPVKTPEWVPKLVAVDFAYSREIEKEIDCWFAKYAAETFLSLLPGAVVYENGIMRADNIEIAVKFIPDRSLCVDTEANEAGGGLFAVERITGLEWPRSIQFVAADLGFLPLQNTENALNSPNGRATSATPNGHHRNDGPSIIAPPMLSSHETSNEKRDPAPEIIPPPRTSAEIYAFITTIDRSMALADRAAMVKTALRGIVYAKLDPVSEAQCLQQIKDRTGLDLGALRSSLKQLRSNSGESQSVGNAQVTEICRRYIHVKAAGAFWDRQMRTMLKIDAVRQAHWSDMPGNDYGDPADPFDVMLKGIFGQVVDRVDKITFMPGANEIFEDQGAVALNNWTPPDIVAVAGDPSPFLEHISYIFDGNSEAIDYLLDWLAHLMQKPARKIKVTILIIGEPGIGKSLIAEMMSKLIGRRNMTAIEESDLSSAFNEWMDGKLLVVVNELMTLDRQQTMNRLKSYITDPWLRINRKGVQTYDYENRAHFMLFSNFEDAAKIETGDRRYFVWISKAKRRDPAQYADLMRWFEDEGGAEAVLYFLQQRDISGFNPDAPAPLTESKKQVIELSRTATEAYLQEALNTGDAPFEGDLVAINDAIDYLRKEKNMTVSHTVLSKFLRKVDAVSLGQISLDDGRRPVIWAVRDVELWNKVREHNVALLVRHYYRRPGVHPPLTDEEKAAMKAALKLNCRPK